VIFFSGGDEIKLLSEQPTRWSGDACAHPLARAQTRAAKRDRPRDRWQRRCVATPGEELYRRCASVRDRRTSWMRLRSRARMISRMARGLPSVSSGFGKPSCAPRRDSVPARYIELEGSHSSALLRPTVEGQRQH